MKKLMFEIVPGKVWIGPHLLDIDAETKRDALTERGISIVVNLWHTADDVLAGVVANYHHHSLPDGKLKEDDIARYDRLARTAHKHLASGGALLAQCYGGRNRSGLVAALTARYWLGIPGAEAVALVKAGRGPSALSNRHFVSFLTSLPAPGVMEAPVTRS